MLKWIDDRLSIKTFFLRPAISRGKVQWMFLPGFLTFFLLFFELITGLYLSLHYIPQNVQLVETRSFFVLYVSRCHSIGAHLLLIVASIYFLKNLLVGFYRRPREIHWLTLSLLLFLICLSYCAGTLLSATPAAQKTFSLLLYFFQQIPLGSVWISFLGLGEKLDATTLQHLFALHGIVLTVGIYFLVLFYLWLFTRRRPRRSKKKVGN